MENQDTLNSNVAAVAVAESSGAKKNDELIVTADKERVLSYVTKALALDIEAKGIHANLTISIKDVSLLPRRGARTSSMTKFLPYLVPTEDDPELLVVVGLSRTLCAATMDTRYRPALDKGLKYVDEFMEPHPPREWKGRNLEMHKLHEDDQITIPYNKLKLSTLRVQEALIELGNLWAVKDCMMQLAAMAMKVADEELLDQLEGHYG
ncbi:hypothetical protein MFIFM68171_10037 [Madurella fahalii]|uniref:Uncharacterized protein n=1 Tax=Madurella fahalii TaxID=1157608 RepID=A0ABQ0GPZ9_9PEZI